MVETIKEAFGSAERIGVIGSPSSTGGLTIDILGTAVNKRLVGNLNIFHFVQDGEDHYALGQITEITMQNVWTQDPTMRGLIRQKGRVDPITERQDVHTATMMPSSVFCSGRRTLEQSILGTIPPTGTFIKLLDENIMDALLTDYTRELFYLGRVYGTNIRMPMWFKHFGSGPAGVREAYHIGVFGKTGSGKSVLAKMMMLGYAKHENMAICILDPQGEFAKDLSSNYEIKKLCNNLGKDVKVFHAKNLVLDDWGIFIRILARSKFWEGLVRSPEYRINAGNTLKEFIEKRIKGTTKKKSSEKGYFAQNSSADRPEEKRLKFKSIYDILYSLYEPEVFENIIWDIVKDVSFQKRVYSKRYAEEFKDAVESATSDDYYERWLPVAKLFTRKERKEKAITINRLIQDEIFTSKEERRPIIVIDLSKESAAEGILWNDEIQTLVVKRILDRLTEEAEKYYKENKLLNSLIIIDEAHRFAPREHVDDEISSEVKATLIDAVRTTRKYGLGWMFISQTLSSLDKEIINQIRIYVFGFGLAWGMERRALLEIIGGQKEALSLYQMFKDPQSGLGEREYPFMTIGPISPLSFSGTPLFFTALKYPNDFLKINFGGEVKINENVADG